MNLSECAVLSVPGTYTLIADVAAVANVCMVIGSFSVTLDCAQHKITGALVITGGYSNVMVENCTVSSILETVDATNVTIANSTVSAPIMFEQGQNVTLRGNHVVISSGSPAGAIMLAGGTNNQVVGNTIDGGYHGSDLSGDNVAGAPGADDGVILANESGDTIQSNTIQNTFDAGIEIVDALSQSTLAGNTISNAVYAGIGSYWCPTWTGNTITGNVVSSSVQGIAIFYTTGDACAAWGQVGSGAFSNNTITNNQLTAPLGANPWGALILLTPAQTVSGNVFQGNDFQPAPIDLEPNAGFMNGGGNSCVSTRFWSC